MSGLIQTKANEKTMAKEPYRRGKKNPSNQIDVMKSLFFSLAESVQQLRALMDLLPVR